MSKDALDAEYKFKSLAEEFKELEPENEIPPVRGFYVVVTKDDERYLVDTYSAATAAFIVESQFGEIVYSVNVVGFKKILLMGASTNGSDKTTCIETPNSNPEAQDTGDGFATDDAITREAEARR